jgi:hypothetical protein
VEGRHQVAVDVAGPLGAQLARQHRQHGLVQQGHAPAHAALPDQRPPLEQVAAGDQVGVAVAAADPAGPDHAVAAQEVVDRDPDGRHGGRPANVVHRPPPRRASGDQDRLAPPRLRVGPLGHDQPVAVDGDRPHARPQFTGG